MIALAGQTKNLQFMAGYVLLAISMFSMVSPSTDKGTSCQN